ncbi:MAG: efflux transporter periplasmic adaptor subunit, partial [Betaproteobacteria bacterium]|nr:efflux transporter periplasmic adaptor subunit [Betaproteobacteria bacterium]
DAVAPNAVTMDSLVTKRVVLPGAQPEAPAEAKADTPTAPAAKAETKPANAKTAATAQRLPADRA